MKIKIPGLSLDTARETKRAIADAPKAAKRASQATLKATPLNVFRIKHTDLDEWVTAKYFEFDFVFATGHKPGQTVEYRVTGRLDTDALKSRANAIRQGHRVKSVQQILDTAAHDGVIPAGMYIVAVRKPPDARTQYRRLLESGLDPASPELVALRKRYAKDKDFTRWAAAMDNLARAA